MTDNPLDLDAVREPEPEEYRNDSLANVGEGWQPVVLGAMLAIERVDPGATVDQIKEKFGGLRLYVTPSEGSDDVTKFIVQAIATAAETKAGNLCEDCGGFPVRNEPVGRWYRTLCVNCRGAAWAKWHERMTSPASEGPYVPDRPVEFDTDEEPDDMEGIDEWADVMGDAEYPAYDDVIDPDEPTPEGWGEDAETDENEERGDLAMAVREAGHPDVADEIGGMSIEDAREVAGEFVPDHVEGD